MRSPRRLLAVVAAAATLCLVATGCDTSPVAASINGQTIRQAALNQQLAELSSNKTFISTYIEAPASSDNESEGLQVKGEGSSTFTSKWTATVLTTQITAAVVRQHLDQTGNLPTSVEVDAARALAAAYFGQGLTWWRFSAAVRDRISQYVADLGQIVPAPSGVTASQIQSVFNTYQVLLFTNICLRNVDVNVTGANGVNFPASLTRANHLRSLINAAGVHGAHNPGFGGSVSCYNASEFDALPLSTVEAALNTKTGQAAAPQRTSDGYQVVAVMSRAAIPHAAFLKALYAVSQVPPVNSTGSKLPAIDNLLAKASVKVSPSFGTWKKTSNGYAVVSPAGPAKVTASAAGDI